MLRSGPFSDERIVGLLNVRFVPLYFDLGARSPAADPAAKKFVIAAKQELAGRSVPTPPVLVMTTDGEVLAEVSNYATENKMLAALRKVLAQHPEFAAPGEQEANQSRLQRARILHCLGSDEQACALLDGQRTAAETLFCAKVARRRGDGDQMNAMLAELDAERHAADIALVRARLAWQENDHEAVLAGVANYPADGPRAAEARYHLGLAQFHGGDAKTARGTWRQLVEQHGEGPWSYRADWAFAQTTDEGLAKRKRSFSTSGSKSLFGRHGYMGRQNPDLAKRR